MNEIVESFGLRQVELTVLESAAGEFTRLGRANIFEPGQRGEQGGQHRAAAMDMKFRDVFSGRAGRTRKPQDQGAVDRMTAGRIDQGPQCRSPRRRYRSTTKSDHCSLGSRP